MTDTPPMKIVAGLYFEAITELLSLPVKTDATIGFYETEEVEKPWAVVRICPKGEGERALAACYIDGSLSHHRETVINVQRPNKFDMELVLAQSEYALGPGRHGRKK